MPLTPRPLAMAQSIRAFSTTPAPQKKKLPPCPPYPYPPARWYKKQNRGLFGGQTIRFGNKVSEEYERKSRRSWHPNVQNKKLYSVALNQWIRIKTTTRVLRTIDKLGGIDHYLLGDKTTRIKHLGPVGWELRWRVLHSDYVKSRLRRTGNTLGIQTDMAQRAPAETPSRLSRQAQMTKQGVEEDARRSASQVVGEAQEAMAETSEAATEHDEVLEIEDPAEPDQAGPAAMEDSKASEPSRSTA